jgi:hypothetical protein
MINVTIEDPENILSKDQKQKLTNSHKKSLPTPHFNCVASIQKNENSAYIANVSCDSLAKKFFSVSAPDPNCLVNDIIKELHNIQNLCLC